LTPTIVAPTLARLGPLHTFSQRIGARLSKPLERLVGAVAWVHPDVLTIIGLALNGVACALLASAGSSATGVTPSLLRAGGLMALLASVFDMLDGRVARRRGRETSFGAFLDSTMDRYSDMLLYMGLLILYARLDRTPLMVLVWVAAFGSFMTSYARARAESLVPSCTVGFLERPERLGLLILGAVANHMIAALWVIAVLSNIAAIQRVAYAYLGLKHGFTHLGRRP